MSDLRDRIAAIIDRTPLAGTADEILREIEATHVLAPKAALTDMVVLPRDRAERLRDYTLSALEYDESVVKKAERALQYGDLEDDIYLQDAVEVVRATQAKVDQ